MSQTQVQSGFIRDNAVTTAKLDSTVSGALVPIGGIIMWSGSVATIPSSWRLCNGANGTPNLQDRFIVGAGSGYAVAATGGSADATLVSHSHTGTTDGHSADHSHSISDPGHSHSMQIQFDQSAGSGFRKAEPGGNRYPRSDADWINGAGTGISVNGAGTGINGTNGTSNDHTHTFGTSDEGSSATNANLPPYVGMLPVIKY
jgi:hypothetical protein